MTRTVRQLRVWLDQVPVGRLTLDDRGVCEFALQDSYRQRYPRPVLGQQFEDDLYKSHHARSRLPRWFSNLLPEGALRQLVEHQFGNQEFELLAQLGKDLPGAVRLLEEAQPDTSLETLRTDASHEASAQVLGLDTAWHFSLAGVQLKFSATRTDRGMTVPVSGQGGDWILKLPDARYPNVPSNEYATMRWAAASGIEIPEMTLIDLGDVSGLPHDGIPRRENLGFAVRRFDRLPSGQRIHMEDFAQILDLFPEQKYSKFNYETIARTTLALAGEAGLAEFIRRLVFMVASGNGDAHHKNWSLLYPDGVHAVLSPAYDQVSTIQYMPNDGLALNFGRSKNWRDIQPDTFRRLARKIGFDEARVMAWTSQAVVTTGQAWNNMGAALGYDTQARLRITQHLASVPLFSGI